MNISLVFFENDIQRNLMGKGDIPKTKIHKLVVNPAIKANIFFRGSA